MLTDASANKIIRQCLFIIDSLVTGKQTMLDIKDFQELKTFMKNMENDGPEIIPQNAIPEGFEPCPNCESALSGGAPNANLDECSLCGGTGILKVLDIGDFLKNAFPRGEE